MCGRIYNDPKISPRQPKKEGKKGLPLFQGSPWTTKLLSNNTD
jgi:hypothetical protein